MTKPTGVIGACRIQWSTCALDRPKSLVVCGAVMSIRGKVTTTEKKPKPLEGIRVLELGQVSDLFV